MLAKAWSVTGYLIIHPQSLSLPAALPSRSPQQLSEVLLPSSPFLSSVHFSFLPGVKTFQLSGVMSAPKVCPLVKEGQDKRETDVRVYKSQKLRDYSVRVKVCVCLCVHGCMCFNFEYGFMGLVHKQSFKSESPNSIHHCFPFTTRLFFFAFVCVVCVCMCMIPINIQQ